MLPLVAFLLTLIIVPFELSFLKLAPLNIDSMSQAVGVCGVNLAWLAAVASAMTRKTPTPVAWQLFVLHTACWACVVLWYTRRSQEDFYRLPVLGAAGGAWLGVCGALMLTPFKLWLGIAAFLCWLVVMGAITYATYRANQRAQFLMGDLRAPLDDDGGTINFT